LDSYYNSSASVEAPGLLVDDRVLLGPVGGVLALGLGLVPVLSRMPASILERMTYFHVATLSSRLLHLPCVARKWLSLFFLSRLSPALALVYGDIQLESPNTNKLTAPKLV